MPQREIFVISAQRTAIGSFGGSLKDVPLATLATTAVRGALQRAAVAPAEIGHLVMGTVIPTEPRDCYLARIAAIEAGIPQETPAFNVNRLCGSGLQAIVSAAQTIAAGRLRHRGRRRRRVHEPRAVPAARGALGRAHGRRADARLRCSARCTTRSSQCHMGITAENVAAQLRHHRARCRTQLAVESHRARRRAIAEGRFKSQIVPVEMKTRKGTVSVRHRRARARATRRWRSWRS